MKKCIAWGIALLFAAGMLAASPVQAKCGGCGGGEGGDGCRVDADTKTNESGAAIELKKEIQFQTICPVMGEKIKKTLFVDHDGKRVYVCCHTCVGIVKKDPAKYIKKLEDEGITVAKVQTTCPVMTGEKINKKLYVDHDGKRIYVCCKGCLATVQKDPAKYIKTMEEEGITLDPAGK